MKTLILISVMLVVTSCSTTNNNLWISSYEVTKITDWDTIRIDYKWTNQSVRLLWIDTPESNRTRRWYIECFWNEAKEYLKLKLEWKKVFIEIDKNEFDRYNRLLAYVYVDEWWKKVFINKEILKNWFWDTAFLDWLKYRKEFEEIKKKAKENNLWFWNYCNWEFKEKEYILNKECDHKNPPKCKNIDNKKQA